MMDNQSLRDRFRHQLTNVHALTVLTVSLLEIIGYVILILSGIETFSLQNHYLWYGVVFPIAVNTATHLIARHIVTRTQVSRQRKNQTIIVAALITSFIVAILHKEYIVTSCAFIFPMILSSIFNDRKLLHVSFAASIFILLAVGVAFWLDRSITLTSAINLFILFGFSFVSYLCAMISINFSKQNYTTIESQAAENDKLQQDVLRDQMTGLYNHNAFVTQLDKHIKDCPESSLCLAMVDVDNFKSINDTYGHDCGDVVLIHLAQTIQAHCGKHTAAYRYGGEEFAVLFTGPDAEEAQAVMEAILARFRSHTFPFTHRPITFSAGIARYAPNLTRDAFFEAADKTLYKAKHAGKNQVLTAE